MGIGYGGSCFPKDAKASHWLSNYYDNEIRIIKAVVEGLKVSMLGLLFKPDMDTLRETPSLDTIPILLDDRAIIKTWDPVAIHHVKEKFDNTLIYCETIERF